MFKTRLTPSISREAVLGGGTLSVMPATRADTERGHLRPVSRVDLGNALEALGANGFATQLDALEDEIGIGALSSWLTESGWFCEHNPLKLRLFVRYHERGLIWFTDIFFNSEILPFKNGVEPVAATLDGTQMMRAGFTQRTPALPSDLIFDDKLYDVFGGTEIIAPKRKYLSASNMRTRQSHQRKADPRQMLKDAEAGRPFDENVLMELYRSELGEGKNEAAKHVLRIVKKARERKATSHMAIEQPAPAPEPSAPPAPEPSAPPAPEPSIAVAVEQPARTEPFGKGWKVELDNEGNRRRFDGNVKDTTPVEASSYDGFFQPKYHIGDPMLVMAARTPTKKETEAHEKRAAERDWENNAPQLHAIAQVFVFDVLDPTEPTKKIPRAEITMRRLAEQALVAPIIAGVLLKAGDDQFAPYVLSEDADHLDSILAMVQWAKDNCVVLDHPGVPGESIVWANEFEWMFDPAVYQTSTAE